MTDANIVSLILSAFALIISGATLWLTLLRRGAVRMTQPTSVFIGPDGSQFDGKLKVYFRALLYTTAKRGIVIENMHVTLAHGESRDTYPIWVLGEERLSRGSGIFVNEQGVIANHHFLRPAGATNQPLASGEYAIEIFAKVVGKPRRIALFRTVIAISDFQASELKKPNTGIYFDWGPESQKYLSHVETKSTQKLPPDIAAILGPLATSVTGNSEKNS